MGGCQKLEGGADYVKCFETLRNAWYRENPDKGLDLAGADTETRRTIIGILDHIPNTESLMEAASNTSWEILAFLAPLLQPGRLDYAWQKDNLSSQIIKNTWNAWTDAIFDWKELFTKESDRSALLFAKDKNAIKSALETLKEDERWNERLRKQW